MTAGRGRSGHVITERGSASIVTAAVLVGVMTLALGAADLARVLLAASRAQTAADAAALAAAQSLAFPDDVEPTIVAADLAELNGGRLRSCVCESPVLEARVTVEVAVGPLLLSSDDRVAIAEARAVVDLPPA